LSSTQGPNRGATFS